MLKKAVGKEANEISDLISQAEAARLGGVTRGAIQDLVGGRLLVYRSEVINCEKGETGRQKQVTN